MNTIDNFHDFDYTDWVLIENHFDPKHSHSRETIFTIGNGYLGTRGSFEEGYTRSLPATFINGVYDEVPVVYTELANCPDWLTLVVTINSVSPLETIRDRFRLDQGEILWYQRKLDLRYGILSRSLRWRSPKGNTLQIDFERFTSLADEHVLGQRCQITPLNFAGAIEVQASINGYPENQGFNHWEELDQGKSDHGIWLHSRTRNSRIDIGVAARMIISGTEAELQANTVPGYPTLNATLTILRNSPPSMYS